MTIEVLIDTGPLREQRLLSPVFRLRYHTVGYESLTWVIHKMIHRRDAEVAEMIIRQKNRSKLGCLKQRFESTQ